MLFWILAAGLTALFTLLVLWPLFRPEAGLQPSNAEHDVEVYGAQLAELEGDVARGTITPEEAETAKAEIGRRLLRAAKRAGATSPSRQSITSNVAIFAVLVALFVPGVAFGLYSTIGSPGTPDLPLAARRMAPQDSSTEALIAHVEQRLKDAPDDGRGWDVIAPVYLRLNRPEDAAKAFRNAIRLLGTSPMRESGLGEALTRIAGGEVTDEARAAFDRAVSQDKSFLPARFFVALDDSQEEDYAAAERAWSALIADSTPDAPWMKIAQEGLSDARSHLGKSGDATAEANASSSSPPASATAPSMPGPTGADMEAAASLSPGDRQEMIQGMVSRLAERLRQTPEDADGWRTLIRSYAVLGERDKARQALADAEKLFAPETPERTAINALSTELGLDSESNGAPPPDRSASAAQAMPEPSAADMAAAAELSATDRQAMIKGMVAQLAEKLDTQPNDVEGWKRLIRSYAVLNDRDSARLAFQKAEKAFADGTPERQDIAVLARQLGLAAEGETKTP
ncbi:c-type cytochrome biogenesis protein CcmI [Consotaella salsifontis]|uniref:Cytochrome c-type biogenesis protein CcmH n=1 Tax=Consotaella salsifontis TaxID=1365950 RepID=A0A1T4MCM2_9HYPH|nr:c-type cytochrome biogenesis protein CcmI [Consotaella salsifontis]SJZ64611.1 cytochrome c-type biogenesis protein CcmH [Consotaella salsifontis]